MPKGAPTPQAQSEVGAAAIRKSPIFVAAGEHDFPLEIDGREGYVISYQSQVEQKDIYNIQLTVAYDETQYLLASCSYGIRLTDDMADELLAKLKELRFVAHPG